MAITAGSAANASDFISSSAGAGSVGQVPKLNSVGQLDKSFISGAYFNPVANGAITAGEALIIGNGTSGYLTVSNAVGSSTQNLLTAYGGETIGQTFITSATTTAIRAVGVRISCASGLPYTYQLDLYATSGNLPIGSSLGSVTLNFSSGASGIQVFAFSSSIAVSASMTYAAVISATGGNSINPALAYYNNGGGYASDYYLTYSGSSWSSNASYSLYCEVWECLTAAGKVQPSDTTQTIYSTDLYDLADNFCGFALASVSRAANVGVNFGPLDINQSGLTIGSEYYLHGAAGAIGTSAGAVSVKIGLALSATVLLIKFDNTP